MKEESTQRKIPFKSEVPVPIRYKRVEIFSDLRSDFFVDEKLVLELKAVETVHPVFEAQVLSYMRLLDVPIGLLINFNVSHIFKEGQKTYVNDLYRHLDD